MERILELNPPLKTGSDLTVEGGSMSFSGATHPLEPIDTDLMKGPFLKDLSIRVPLSSPFNTKNSSVSDSMEKECVWDASLPPSGTVSPHSSIDSYGVATAMSIVTSSTSRSDGMFSMERNWNCETTMKDGIKKTHSLDQSAKSSASSGLSDESNYSGMSGSGCNKPHKGNDPRWMAILGIRARDGCLGMSHFRLLKRLGCGDIGSVYLSELSGTRCNFAMKVMDKASLASRKKLSRAQTEREILQLLDHPFLPSLYAHFETERFSCLVMEFCPGGDLHALRQRQPGKHFSEYSARFYAAEVLLALEYLHMLGVVYRDLKPENVLVREDGHIMLSDFDLSLRCVVSPTLIRLNDDPIGQQPACTLEPSSMCIQPPCLTFPPKKKKNPENVLVTEKRGFTRHPELVAEPTSARSMSFVGTHEYLAPEIIKGEGHGSAVDWWTFGIFLHELLFGRTPFKGSGNRATMFNVVGQALKFPDAPVTSHASRDLVRGLLVKEPQGRVGVKRGAAQIKQHPFFQGVNWALIRCSTPPEVPRRPPEFEMEGKKVVGREVRSGEKYLDFEFF